MLFSLDGRGGGTTFFFMHFLSKFVFAKVTCYIAHIITVVGTKQKHKGMFL